MNIVHKTKVQMVILRFWMGLYLSLLIGSKVITQMQKNEKTQEMQKKHEKTLHKWQVIYKIEKKLEREILCFVS